MTISYYKAAATGGSIITALGIAGGILLGLGLSAYSGHTWQIITGSSLLGTAGVSAVAFSCYMLIPRSETQILKAFSKSEKSHNTVHQVPMEV
jgi:hypothetical protein